MTLTAVEDDEDELDVTETAVDEDVLDAAVDDEDDDEPLLAELLLLLLVESGKLDDDDDELVRLWAVLELELEPELAELGDDDDVNEISVELLDDGD